MWKAPVVVDFGSSCANWGGSSQANLPLVLCNASGSEHYNVGVILAAGDHSFFAVLAVSIDYICNQLNRSHTWSFRDGSVSSRTI